jgi:hypothetical protein
MTKITISIQDNKAPFLMELLKSLKYVKVEKKDAEQELFLKELKQAMLDLKKLEQGKLKGRNIKHLLNEL